MTVIESGFLVGLCLVWNEALLIWCWYYHRFHG